MNQHEHEQSAAASTDIEPPHDPAERAASDDVTQVTEVADDRTAGSAAPSADDQPDDSADEQADDQADEVDEEPFTEPVTEEVPPVSTEPSPYAAGPIFDVPPTVPKVPTVPLPPPTPPAWETPAQDDRPRRGGNVRAGLVGGLVGAVVAALVAAGTVAVLDDDAAPVRAEGQEAAAEDDVPTVLGPMDIHAVLEKVEPSVVSIAAESSSFGGRMGESAGSGIIISADGLVLTNAHVVDDASGIEIRTFDGDTFDADIIGIAPGDDIALLQLRGATGLTPAELGSSASLRVGDEVVAIGNALALGGDPTVTRGIVSAKERDLTTRGSNLENLIQTDAAIYPGNSGGALVNGQGEVVGVNTAVAVGPQGQVTENIGFAIAIDSVKALIERLKEGSTVQADTFLGVRVVTVSEVDEEILDNLGITAEQGAMIAAVDPGTPADDAGLRQGDVIVEIDGEEVTAAADVGRVVKAHEPGDVVRIELERDGRSVSMEVELGSRTAPIVEE